MFGFLFSCCTLRLCLESVIFNWFLQSWWCYHGSLEKGLDRDNSKSKASVLFFARPQTSLMHKTNNMWKPHWWRGSQDFSHRTLQLSHRQPRVPIRLCKHAHTHTHSYVCLRRGSAAGGIIPNSQQVTQISFPFFPCSPLLTWNIGSWPIDDKVYL